MKPAASIMIGNVLSVNRKRLEQSLTEYSEKVVVPVDELHASHVLDQLSIKVYICMVL